ncbi:shikimate dehydrogenase [soil metagenome]
MSNPPIELSPNTRFAGVMGWPVDHSLSPAMQNAALKAEKLDVVYVKLPVPPGHLGEMVVSLEKQNFVGANVTVPHKVAVLEFMHRLTKEAKLIGAVNTIRVENDGSLTGHNTDCIGAVKAMEADGTNLRGKVAVILGAGGAGRGVAVGCAMAGAAKVIVLNRTPEKAQELVAEMETKEEMRGVRWEARALDDRSLNWDKVDAVFQMTSAGMKGIGDSPMDVSQLPKNCHVLEAVYAPLETAFLKAARAKGLRSTDGLAMLLEQGAAAFEFWFARRADRNAMRKALIEATQRR